MGVQPFKERTGCNTCKRSGISKSCISRLIVLAKSQRKLSVSESLSLREAGPDAAGLEISDASKGSFACDEMIAFGFGVRLDDGQVRASGCRSSLFHFNFGERKTSVELDALIT